MINAKRASRPRNSVSTIDLLSEIEWTWQLADEEPLSLEKSWENSQQLTHFAASQLSHPQWKLCTADPGLTDYQNIGICPKSDLLRIQGEGGV